MAVGDLAAIKPQVYKDSTPAEAFYEAHWRVRTRRPNLVHEFARVISGVLGFLFLRMGSRAARFVWRPGRMIIAPDHNSNFDHFIVGWFTWRRVHFMAKSSLFKGQFLTWFFSSGGTFPIRRGHRDEEGMATARIVLERERALIMYCEGGRSRDGKPTDTARPGIGRLALETGARVVPCSIRGSDRIRNWKRLEFPKVTVRYGRPLRFKKIAHPTSEQSQWAANIIHKKILQLRAELAEGSGRPRRRLRLHTSP